MALIYIVHAGPDGAVVDQVWEELRKAGLGQDIQHFDASRDNAYQRSDEQVLARAAAADCVILIWSPAMIGAPRSSCATHAAIQAWSRDRFVLGYLGHLEDAQLPAGLRDLAAQPLKAGPALESLQIGGGRVREEDISFLVKLVEARISGSVNAGVLVGSSAPMARSAPAPSAPPPPMAAPRRSSGRLAIVSAVSALLLIGAATALLTVRYNIEQASNSPSPAPWIVGGLALATLLAGGTVWLRSRRIPVRVAPAAPRARTAPAPSPEPASGHHVFVSYSRQDAAKVDAVVQQIKAAGYTVWLDTQSSEAAQRYAGQIVRAIRASKVVALMCSRNSFGSDHVVREVYLAGDSKKPFVCVTLDEGLSDADFPDELLYFVTGFPRLKLADLAPGRMRSEIARFVAV